MTRLVTFPLTILAYASFDQLNVVFNIATIVVAIAVAFPIIRSRRKDTTIHELTQASDSKDRLIRTLESDLEGASTRAKRAETECHEVKLHAEHWEARYKEQEKYTAQGALELIGERLASLQTAITTAFASHNELILQNASLLSKLEERLSNGKE